MTELPHASPPLQIGKPNPHIKASSGADPDIYNFYSTRYSTSYGIKDYVPRSAGHTGTGYQSNIRPQYSYNTQLDEYDNPVLARMLADNYDTVTKKCFRPYSVPHGREPLPALMPKDNVGTGFTNQEPLTIPTVAKVYEPYARPANGAGVLPSYKPHLHKIQPKAPLDIQNAYHGPDYMETENKAFYTNKNNEPKDMFAKTTGPLCGSAFTNNKNIEPVTFHHDLAYKDPSFNDRPVGNSEYIAKFLQTEGPSGAEPIPRMPAGGNTDTGYTREEGGHPRYKPKNKFLTYSDLDQMPKLAKDKLSKADPAAFLNVTHPDNKSALYGHNYQGVQSPEQSLAAKLNRMATGENTGSGYKANTTIEAPETLLHTVPDDKKRFLTHYDVAFYDKNPVGKQREGRVIGAVQPHTENGVTKSNNLHTGPGARVSHDPQAVIAQSDAYQGRSIKARDGFFDDHTYDAKKKGYMPPEASKNTALAPSMNIQKPRLQPFEHDPVFTGARVGTPRQRHTQHWAVGCH